MCEKLGKELTELNDLINSLKVWDGYAERLQQQYDWLLADYNK